MKTKEIQKCQINVHLILLKNNSILMLRRANTGFKDGMYSLPAGKIDRGETIWEALAREANEEVGINITPQKQECLKMTNILHRYSLDGTVAIDFFLLLQQFQGTPRNMEPNKCDDVSWIDMRHFPMNTIPYVRRGIENALNRIVFDEYIWE